MIHIDRCICADMTFKDLLEQAASEGRPPEQIADACGMGAGCHMCEPYVQHACATGQTVFTELILHGDRADTRGATAFDGGSRSARGPSPV